jgi:hypothetical protein
MAKNRKAATKMAVDHLRLIDPSNINAQLLEEMLGKLSDAEFSTWIEALRAKKDYVPIVNPNGGKVQVSIENNLKIAEKFGVKFYQRIKMVDPSTGVPFLTPKEYLVIHLPVRRQIEALENKISLPDDNRHVDDLTDQPTGPSKGSALSFPELLVLHSQGHRVGILELIKVRGGDLKAMNEVHRQILTTGNGRVESVLDKGTKPKAIVSLSIFMKGMHYGNNFNAS